MRIKILLICFVFAVELFAQNHPPNALPFQGHYLFNSLEPENDKLFIFLHGGVENPYFKNPIEHIKVSFLLDKNTSFLSIAKANAYDVILPIADDSLNWIKQPEKCFDWIVSYVKSLGKTYREIYIGGFSDGATGSFKIFYKNVSYFNGLVVFNGFPQHQNFSKTVDYSTVKEKSILFFGTKKDKIVPYEFILTEYCQQKQFNSQSFLFVTEGEHRFDSYTAADIELVFDLLKSPKSEETQRVPLHGFVRNNQLVDFYPFRKSIVRKFGFGKEYYNQNKAQKAALKN